MCSTWGIRVTTEVPLNLSGPTSLIKPKTVSQVGIFVFFLNSNVNTIPLVQHMKVCGIWWLFEGSWADLQHQHVNDLMLNLPQLFSKWHRAWMLWMSSVCIYCHGNSRDGTKASYLHLSQYESRLLPMGLDSKWELHEILVVMSQASLRLRLGIRDKRIQKENKNVILEEEEKSNSLYLATVSLPVSGKL